ncbi:MAG: glycosyltransferase family 2 protein [Chitinophagales bacterium]|nr:glycosyltransferase family 2 protein [Chitinophagales bacterium]MDW8418621.1 glycosyltransferase family A protein [Chitinophagales bacterium]
MTSKPLFSVLIANYNNGEFLRDAIQSIEQQTYRNWEIVLVDDGSNDNSKDILTQYSKHDKIKVYYNDRNYGCGYKKRRCVELAEGEIAGFLDADDALTPDALEKMVKAHSAHTNASLVYSKTMVCDIHLNILDRSNYQKPLSPGKTYLESPVSIVSHFVTFKVDYYKRTPGINPNYLRAVDQDLYFKLEEVGDLVFIDEWLYMYRQKPNSISQKGNRMKARTWEFIARLDACRRRGLNPENVIAPLMDDALAIHEFYQKSSDYRLGNSLLLPVRMVKKFLGAYNNRS